MVFRKTLLISGIIKYCHFYLVSINRSQSPQDKRKNDSKEDLHGGPADVVRATEEWGGQGVMYHLPLV